MPRLSVASEQFKLTQTGKVFSVADLSPGGMALRIIDREDARLFQVAAIAKGTLKFAGEKWDVTARVRNIRNELIGLSFEAKSPELEAELGKRLDPAALGGELKPRPGGEGGALWYHGTSGTDLLLWRSPTGEYRKLSIFVLGTFVSWERTREHGFLLQTGRWDDVQAINAERSEKSEIRGILRFDTISLSPDAAPDLAKLAVAKTLVNNANLPADLKRWALSVLIV